MAKYQCDVCGKMVDEETIRTVIVYGIETDACEECIK